MGLLQISGLIGLALACPFQASDGPSFEVASVKVARAVSNRLNIIDTGGPGTASPERWVCSNITLSMLIAKAWSIKLYQLSGPSSLEDLRYNITANVSPNSSRADFN